MKKVILIMLSLLFFSLFLVGCSDNLAGEAYRSSRTNADDLMTQIIDKETQICNEKNMRTCPRANEDNVYAFLARSNVFVIDLILNQQPRDLNSLKKTVNNDIGLLQKVASGKGSSRDKLIAKAIIGQTYDSANLETQADILIVADLIAANKLRVSPEDMASVDKMLGSDLLKGISKSGPGMDASTGAMGSLIPPGASQSFFDCLQGALGSNSGGSSQQAPGGGAGDPLMPVGPDGDFSSGSEGGMPSSESQGLNDFNVNLCDKLDFGMISGPSVSDDGSVSNGKFQYKDEEYTFIIEGETTKIINSDSETVIIYSKSTCVETGFVLETVQSMFSENGGETQGYSVEASLMNSDGDTIYHGTYEETKQGDSPLESSVTEEGEWPKEYTGFAGNTNPNSLASDQGNTLQCAKVSNAIETCMDAAGSADICTGIEGMGEQGQVAMVLQDFCNSATGAEIDTSLFDQSVIINEGNMINQAYLMNFFGFTQAQLGDLYSKS